MREDTGSGLMFADQPVGVSGRPQKFAESNREGARNQETESDNERKECAVVEHIEDKANPVSFKRNWGEDELSIASQCTYLGVEISK